VDVDIHIVPRTTLFFVSFIFLSFSLSFIALFLTILYINTKKIYIDKSYLVRNGCEVFKYYKDCLGLKKMIKNDLVLKRHLLVL